jgi:phytol kinase
MKTVATMALVPFVVTAMMAALRFWKRRCAPGAECSRKVMHVGGGLIALVLPYLFSDAAPVLALCAITFVGLLAVRTLPRLKSFGCVIHEVRRRSVGELCVPVSVAFLFVAADGDGLMYAVPLLALTFADSAAALIGLRFGVVRFSSGKTLEGSLAFFAVAFVGTEVPLLAAGGLAPQQGTVVALLLALLLTLVELASGMGLDNFFVPVAGFVLLRCFAAMSAAQVAWQLALVVTACAAFIAVGLPRLSAAPLRPVGAEARNA